MPFFTEALLKEMECQSDYLDGEAIKTLYLGGGTPSYLGVKALEAILEKARQVFGSHALQEITLEVNPDDVSRGAAAAYAAMGFTRISMGVQSFHDQDLQYLHRLHSGAGALKAIAILREAGFNDLSIDLIYGIPGQDLDRWKHNLDILSTLDIPHVSAYWITVEEGTALEKLIKKSHLPPPDEAEGIAHFKYLQAWAARNNYNHYEISNLCKGEQYALHNVAYWQGEKYLGLGPSAHSFNGLERRWNASSLSAYLEGAREGVFPFEKEVLTPLIRYEEWVLTGIRTCWGIDLEQISSVFGERVSGLLSRQSGAFIQGGLIIQEGSRLKLSAEGMLLADRITSELFISEQDWQG